MNYLKKYNKNLKKKN